MNAQLISDVVDEVAWNEWLEYRKAIRKALKPVSYPAARRRLARFGEDQAAVVEQSIAQGWTGLFPLAGKEKKQPERRKTRYEQMQEELRRATES